MTGDRLDSWKEIAAYLKRDVATVRRWEKREGLPVHRHVHQKLGSVYAFTSELDTWLEGRRQQAEPPPPARPWGRRWRWIAAAIALGAVGVVAYLLRGDGPRPAVGGRIRIAVHRQGIGCNEQPATVRLPPVAPTPIAAAPAPEPPPATPPSIVVFTDPATGFSTSDVYEAQQQVVRFNTAGQVIWMADGSVHKRPARGTFEGLVVRFGTKDGVRRAYLVHDPDVYHYDPPPVLVDFEIEEGGWSW